MIISTFFSFVDPRCFLSLRLGGGGGGRLERTHERPVFASWSTFCRLGCPRGSSFFLFCNTFKWSAGLPVSTSRNRLPESVFGGTGKRRRGEKDGTGERGEAFGESVAGDHDGHLADRVLVKELGHEFLGFTEYISGRFDP